MNKKLWIVEAVIIVLMIITSIGKNNSIIFDEANTEVYGEAVSYTEADHSYSVDATNISSDADLSQGYAMIGNKRMPIHPGAYKIIIQYTSQTNTDVAVGNSANVAGWVQARSYENPSDVKYNTIQLVDGYTEQTDRMWITSFATLQDLDFKVFFAGTGELKIHSIVIEELLIWRVTRILGVILLFAFINLCYWVLFGTKKAENRNIVAGILLIIIVSSLPAFNDFVVGGHDLPFHLSRILSLGRTLESGRIWSPIEYDMVNGYGYATPLFYGQLFLYLPAILYLMAIPIHICYQIYVICINAATCLICYYCCKRIIGKSQIALFGAAFYTMAAYRISNVYVRAAVGEYTAMVFLPLIVLGFWLVFTKDKEAITWKEYIPIVIGLTGVLHSHVLTTEITAVFIIITCIILWKRTFRRKRLIALCKAAGLTVLVNLSFLVPFLDAMKMNTTVKTADAGTLQESGAYLVQLFGVFMTASGKSLEKMQGDMPICLGFACLIGLVIFGWCYSKRCEWKNDDTLNLKAGSVAFILTIVAILFSLAAFPWDSVKLINRTLGKYACVIQFPWRYLTIATVLCVFVTVAAIAYMDKSGRVKEAKIGMLIMLVFAVVNTGHLFMEYTNVSISTQMYASMSPTDTITNIYGGEYLLDETDTVACLIRQAIPSNQNVVIDNYAYNNGVTTFECINNSQQQEFIDIPVFRYTHYHAYDTGTGEELAIEQGTNQCIRVMLPAGFQSKVQVKYVIPVMWYIAFGISMITCAGMIIGYLLQRRAGIRD